MTKIYALYHHSRTMPLGLYATESLAFEAVNHYSPLFGGDTLTELPWSFGGEKRGFDVIVMKVHNRKIR